MAVVDLRTLSAAKTYTDESLLGGGAIKGANAVIAQIKRGATENEVVFEWTLADGSKQTDSIIVKNGKDGEKGKDGKDGIDGIDGEKGDKGDQGDKGIGIESITKKSSAGLVDTYLIVFTDGTESSFDVVNGANITKTSQLENDSNFITNVVNNLLNYYTKDEVYTKANIDELLRNVGAGLSVKIVTVLPTEEISGTTIYLIKTSGNNYNQYMWIDNAWANLGSTTVDLSNYYTKDKVEEILLGYVTKDVLASVLIDYVKKSELAKVATSNDYNDLDNLPQIPDVSGIKPYTNVLQDSENTAPTSKALYDAVSGINSEVEKKAKSSDVGNISELSTTDKSSVVAAINEINDSLVGIGSALDDKADKAELNAIPLLYNQNTDILAYALTCPQAKRTLVRIHSANATNNPFGVTSDTDFIYEISKIDSDSLWISIKAKDVRTNREFLNTKNDVNWLGWQELVTMDKIGSIPIEANRTITFSNDYTEITVYRCGYNNIRAHIEIDALCNIIPTSGWVQDMGIVLSEGYRPSENISIPAWCISDIEAHIPITLMIGSNGKLSGFVGQSHTSIKRLNITVTYFK